MARVGHHPGPMQRSLVLLCLLGAGLCQAPALDPAAAGAAATGSRGTGSTAQAAEPASTTPPLGRAPAMQDQPIVLTEHSIITLNEQLQQAWSLNEELTPEQLARANPLIGTQGRLPAPQRKVVADWPDGYVAICAIVKNQAQDLREWIEYHKYIGTKKIYVYDNNSTEPLAGAIADHLRSGLVEYSYFVGRQRVRDLFRTSSQWWAYNDCVARYATRHRWLAFIDVDEFIVFHNTTKKDINDFMFDYEAFGGLALNWVIFGSSGHKVRPSGGVLINYNRCIPFDQEQNQHVKVVANTLYLLTMGDDPHRVFYKTRDKYTVNELGLPVKGAGLGRTPASHTKIALYHYLTKSEGEYIEKMKRGSAAGNYKDMSFYYAINELANATCTTAIPLGMKCCPSIHQDLQRAVAPQASPGSSGSSSSSSSSAGGAPAGGAEAPSTRKTELKA